ncbi:MAG: restriction endonuclease subunit S [Pseudomonadota bacterium]
MNITRTSWAAIEADSRWTVALHSRSGGPLHEGRYPRFPLGDLVREHRERLQPSHWPDFPFGFVGLENVTSHTGLLDGFSATMGRSIKSQCGVFHRGDVLYGRLRPYLNKVYAAEEPLHTGICSSEFFVLTPDPRRLHTLFLREVLASGEVQARVSQLQLGSALPRLSLADLLAVPVPLPPLEVQTRLVEGLTTARARLRHTASTAAALPSAIQAAFKACLEEGVELSVVVRPAAEERTWPTTLPPDYLPKNKTRGRPRRLAGLNPAHLTDRRMNST